MTVFLDTTDNSRNAKQLSGHSTTDRLLDSNRNQNRKTETNKTLKKFRIMQMITKGECWKTITSSSNAAHLFGLPKVHKEFIQLLSLVLLLGTLICRPVRELLIVPKSIYSPDPGVLGKAKKRESSGISSHVLV